jgi:hypothetical protein
VETDTWHVGDVEVSVQTGSPQMNDGVAAITYVPIWNQAERAKR